MFSGLASILPSWPGAKWPTTGSVGEDLEIGDESRPRMDDDRLSDLSSFRVADSYPSSIAEVYHERTLPDPPQDELDDDNDLSTSGCGVGPSSEEPASAAAVPGFLSTIGRSASTPPEILCENPPPDSLQQQFQDRDRIHSSTSSSSSISPNNSYARFFHRTRTPKRTRSTRSLGPGGTQGGPSILSPIYEPSSPGSRGSDPAQKEGVVIWPSTSQKQTPAPSVHSTTSTIQERVMCMQAAHPGFLKRPLNRSLSQTSSNSLHSEVSGAPQLPPLHFRPAFAGISVGIHASQSPVPSPGPQSGCRSSHPPTVVVPTKPSPSTTSPRSQPETPQSLTTPRSHRFGFLDHSQKCSAIYEDSASEKSFVTAESGSTEPGPGVITKHDIPSTADLVIYPQDQETEQESGHVERREGDTREQPSSSKVGESALGQPRNEPEAERQRDRGFSESETTFNVAPDLERRPSTIPSTLRKPRGRGRASVMSIASTTVKNESMIGDDGVVEETATVVEEDHFIMERWMKTLFYSASGGKELFSTAKGGEGKQSPPSSACVLFWVGFLAPWCWLVGGWMPPKDTPLHENEMKEEELKEKVSADVDRGATSQGREGGGLRKWVLPDPSSSFGATARAPSTSSTTTLCSRDVEEAKIAVVDPWVRRCRIASIVGGTMLALGLIVMVIVLAVVTK